MFHVAISAPSTSRGAKASAARLRSLTAALLCGLAVLLPVSAHAQLRIGVITSGTGPTALAGIPQKNTVALLPTRLGGLDVEYIAVDDGSDPAVSVSATHRMTGENPVDAIIGPTGSPNAMAMIELVAAAGVPLLAPVGVTSVILPMDERRKWVFKTTQNDLLIGEALFGHMKRNGVRTLGFIGLSDPYGDSWWQSASTLAERHGIQIVVQERYSRQDSSVTGQSLKLLTRRPDAVLVAAPGAAAVLPQTTLADQGYKGRMYQTHGAALPDFLRLGGRKVEGTVLAASLMLVLDEVPDSHPSKARARDFIQRYEAKYGTRPATFAANVWDAALLLEDAVPKALKAGKAGTREFRAALRDALEGVRELVGTQGVYNMSAADHSGFDERGRELITVRDGQWKLLQP